MSRFLCNTRDGSKLILDDIRTHVVGYCQRMSGLDQEVIVDARVIKIMDNRCSNHEEPSSVGHGHALPHPWKHGQTFMSTLWGRLLEHGQSQKPPNLQVGFAPCKQHRRLSTLHVAEAWCWGPTFRGTSLRILGMLGSNMSCRQA